jgi:hypothetical protein
MIDELAQALNNRPWPDYVHQQLGPRVGDVVAPFLRPVIGAAVAGPVEHALPLGTSKIGGLPHVGESFSWPVEDGTDEPLALVCQVNLDEVRKAGMDDGEQLGGMLYLFSIYDSDRAYGYEIDESAAKLLHVARPGPLAVAARPEGLADDGVFEERQLRIGPSLLAEEQDEDGVSAKRFDYEVEQAVEQGLQTLGGVACDVIRLLGMAHPFREETREIVDEFEAPRLLLYVNGYAVQRNAFGEGEFHIVLEQTQLTTGKLETAVVLFEPGT